MTVGEQAIITNAVESIRQHVEQEAAHELADRQTHGLALRGTVLAVILPAKADMVVVEIYETAVGDGDTVGVAGEIGKHLSRACERALGVDDPLDVAQRSKVSSERARLFEASEIGEELEFSRIVQCLKTFEEQAPE